MNQHDQMLRQALLAAEELAEEANGNGNDWNEWCLPRLKKIQEALAHVNKTPKNEHGSADMLKRAPLVRLTDREIFACFDKQNTGDDAQRNVLYFAHAIMDAMERVNGGSNATD